MPIPGAVHRSASVGMGASVHNGATVAANATIGADAEVYPDAHVGLGSIVGDGAKIHQGAKIGYGCIVGAGAIIGAGSSIRHGAIVDDGVVLEAGSVVMPRDFAETATTERLTVIEGLDEDPEEGWPGFASERAWEVYAGSGLSFDEFAGVEPSGANGYTTADVRAVIAGMEG